MEYRMESCDNCKKNSDVICMIRCNHKFCKKCLTEYLKIITTPKVKCMVLKCGKFISDNIIRKCLTNDQIIAYENLSLLTCSQKAIKCLTRDCTYVALCEEGTPTFECEFCQAPNCCKCKLRHYPNDCGRNTANESAIEHRARQMLKNRNRIELEELNKIYYLTPNPIFFECTICCDYFLPREGVILRNCLHCFCMTCLKSAMDNVKYISHMTCPDRECKAPLDSNECLVLRNEKEFSKMMVSEASSRFFQCKNENCQGIWDSKSLLGKHECPVCEQENCMECQDIHLNMSCSDFRKTKRYINSRRPTKVLAGNLKVECHLCKNLLIQDKGCGSMFCDKCGNHTCIFTGKISGQHNPKTCYCGGSEKCTKIDYYCNCTPAKPCHKDCMYGCINE